MRFLLIKMAKKLSLSETLAKKLLKEPLSEPITNKTTFVVHEDDTNSRFFSPMKTRHRQLNKTKFNEVNQKPIEHNKKLKSAQKCRYPLGDIEDAIPNKSTPVHSQYFSPIQTRNARLKYQNPPKLFPLQQQQRPLSTTSSTATKNAKKSTVLPTNEELLIKIEPLEGQDDATPTKIAKILTVNKQDELKSEEVQAETNQKWEPKNWEKILENVRKMRTESAAPVDSMGCDKCSDDTADEKTQRFHKLVALMLSSQTKDETTYAAIQRLHAANVMTPSLIKAIPTTELEKLLHPVSFYRIKAKNIQKTAAILIEDYDSDIPNNVQDLIKLPGVGPKMAHICMATAWNVTTGIGVDVHVHRIANRLNWLPKETKQPEQTRIALEAWLPQTLWQEVNHLFVGFGQTVCKPTNPQCSQCLNRDICPSAFKVQRTNKKKI